jgi:PTH1 family peptidyl-tRNA hydrolase
MTDRWLVIGLGNPGSKYAATRHNIGYAVTDEAAARMGGGFAAHKATRTDVVEGRWAGVPVVLGRSRSYMNESGGPTKALCTYFDVPPERLIVIHDELDIGFGTLRLKSGGGDNGHNGLKSIRASLGTGDFFRVRCGIGRPPGRQEVHDFVLKPFSGEEKKEIPLLVTDAADAIECLMTEGLQQAQSRFNS